MRRFSMAVITVPLYALVLAGMFFGLGYAAMRVFGIPEHLNMPAVIRILGVPLIAAGVFFMVWLFRFRDPLTFLESTAITMQKAARRKPEPAVHTRTEPLVLLGPHRYVRHPFYFALFVILAGWWLVSDYTPLLSLAICFFLWFFLIAIRIEERELRTLFGQEHEDYARSVPRLLPSLRPRWPR